jgi:glutathione synthase/RimK-type ligase-like ATP-grasp enzyme
MLLLAGGCGDPNLSVLADAAARAEAPIIDLRLPVSESPSFCWNPADACVRLAKEEIRPAAAFIRYDALAGMKDSRPAVAARAVAWYQAVMGWLLVESSIRMFNREATPLATNKPAVLVRARQAGLKVPATLITNDVENLDKLGFESLVVKPVAGGDYCYSLSDALAKAGADSLPTASPAIVQQRLVSPEVRIYVIGKRTFAFQLRSDSLDYRIHQDADLVPLPEMPHELAALRRLMSGLRLDFGAADFKTDPDTHQLVFLELNTAPMFSRFDYVSGGQLSAAIISELLE